MAEHIDKDLLNNDLRYRFDYLSKFINFTTDDIAALNKFAKIANPFIRTIADTIYEKLLQYDITKNYFLKPFHGFEGTLVTDESQLTLQSEQMLFRIHSISKYLNRLLRQPIWNDAFLEYISNICKIHTNMGGFYSINIDYIHINALLGYMENTFINAVQNNDQIDENIKKETILALNKLFWIQNDFFTMHYMIALKSEP